MAKHPIWVSLETGSREAMNRICGVGVSGRAAVQPPATFMKGSEPILRRGSQIGIEIANRLCFVNGCVQLRQFPHMFTSARNPKYEHS